MYADREATEQGETGIVERGGEARLGEARRINRISCRTHRP